MPLNKDQKFGGCFLSTRSTKLQAIIAVCIMDCSGSKTVFLNQWYRYHQRDLRWCLVALTRPQMLAPPSKTRSMTQQTVIWGSKACFSALKKALPFTQSPTGVTLHLASNPKATYIYVITSYFQWQGGPCEVVLRKTNVEKNLFKRHIPLYLLKFVFMFSWSVFRVGPFTITYSEAFPLYIFYSGKILSVAEGKTCLRSY